MALDPLFSESFSGAAAQEFLDSIIENIPNMIFVKEAKQLRFVRFNQAGEELLGYSRQELIGKNDYDFFPQEEADFFVSRDHAVLASGKMLDIPEEAIHTRRKGKRILHTKKIPIFSADGKPLYLLGISEDITDRKRVELAEAELYRSRNLEGLGRLAGGVAHDFNNLLTGILGIAAELKASRKTPEPHRKELDQILRAGERAAGLTRQLLAFGRRQVSVPVVLQLNEVIREMQPLLTRLIGPNIQVELKLCPELLSCRIDPGQLEQVLMNVMLNARDAMPAGGKIEVQTKNRTQAPEGSADYPALPAGDLVEITISDTGEGMNEETRSRAFEPFYSTKPKEKGTGLGLSTVHGIVKQNGGDIQLQSAPGKGTSVTILLPRGAAVRPGGSLAVSQKLSTGSESILVVEDEDLVRRTVVRTLEKAGYHVFKASNAAEALAANVSQDIDLLLTDIVMPGMNGRQLAAAFAAQRPGLRVIYMSGYAEDILALRGILNEDIAFLEKTFNAEALLAKVREVLDQPHPPATLAVR